MPRSGFITEATAGPPAAFAPRSGCEFVSLSVSCLALPDAKVNNQSQTTKCAMASGDGNAGECLPLFFYFLIYFFLLLQSQGSMLIQQVSFGGNLLKHKSEYFFSGFLFPIATSPSTVSNCSCGIQPFVPIL